MLHWVNSSSLQFNGRLKIHARVWALPYSWILKLVFPLIWLKQFVRIEIQHWKREGIERVFQLLKWSYELTINEQALSLILCFQSAKTAIKTIKRLHIICHYKSNNWKLSIVYSSNVFRILHYLDFYFPVKWCNWIFFVRNPILYLNT